MQNEMFPMSDNWWIEENKAYFCGTVLNAIFCVDLVIQKCDLIAWIPECDVMDFRQNPYCIKQGNQIFCLPATGKYVWCYNMEHRDWTKIEIEHGKQLYLYNKTGYSEENSQIIWLLEDEVGMIHKINLGSEIIEKEYCISDKCESIEDIYGQCIFLQNQLYCIVENKIKCINLNNDEIITYREMEFKSNLFTICYDGTNFWLSGYCKEIYVWNPEQGIKRVITDFPKQFGFYHFPIEDKAYIDCNSYYKTGDPFFHESIILGKYIWFISSQSPSIIYVDRETYEVNLLDIREERETIDSLKRDFACKYLLEYVRSERYIGLYSIKNHRIFEIDAVELCVKNRNYELSDDAVFSIAKACGYYNDEQKNFQEKQEMDIIFFKGTLKQNNGNVNNLYQNIGKLIYYNLDK